MFRGVLIPQKLIERTHGLFFRFIIQFPCDFLLYGPFRDPVRVAGPLGLL